MSTTLTATQRTQRARIAANHSWAYCDDRTARTLPARNAMMDKFQTMVDPEGILPPAERAKRAENARTEHFQRMAFKSAQARRRK